MKEQTAIDLIVEEYHKASKKFPEFNSAHEGYAVLLEEVEELWDEIKRNNNVRFAPEAVQAGAMCLRFLVDICGKNNNKFNTGACQDCGRPIKNGLGHMNMCPSR